MRLVITEHPITRWLSGLLLAALLIAPTVARTSGQADVDRDEAEAARRSGADAVRDQVPPEQPSSVPSPGLDYRIGRQDLLDIRVFDLEELNRTVRVSEDGSISLPLIGRLEVAGLTRSEMENLVARLLEENFVRDAEVSVFVREYESKKVAVSGAVKNPTTYEMLGPKTLLEMISMAGGLSDNHGEEIVVFRREADGSTVRNSVDLKGLVHEALPALNLAVEPGDIVYVPTAETFRIFVGGAVRSPSRYMVPRNEPMTVLEAITLAGGTTERAAEKKVQVIRTQADGRRIYLAVNLKKVKRGKFEDLVLKEGDVVLVPERFF